MRVFEEEVFGPVAVVERAADLDEAIALANRTAYGLGSSVWTTDPAEQRRCIERDRGRAGVRQRHGGLGARDAVRRHQALGLRAGAVGARASGSSATPSRSGSRDAVGGGSVTRADADPPITYLDHAATSPLRPEVVEAMAPFAAARFGNASGAPPGGPPGPHGAGGGPRGGRRPCSGRRPPRWSSPPVGPRRTTWPCSGSLAAAARSATRPGGRRLLGRRARGRARALPGGGQRSAARRAGTAPVELREAPVDADGAVDLDGGSVRACWADDVAAGVGDAGQQRGGDGPAARGGGRPGPSAGAAGGAPHRRRAGRRLARRGPAAGRRRPGLGERPQAGRAQGLGRAGGPRGARRSSPSSTAGARSRSGAAAPTTWPGRSGWPPPCRRRSPARERRRRGWGRCATGWPTGCWRPSPARSRAPTGAGCCRATATCGSPGSSRRSCWCCWTTTPVCASAGAACASGALEPSHVLLAMGVPPAEARSAVRFTLGHTTTEADVERALAVVPAAVGACG